MLRRAFAAIVIGFAASGAPAAGEIQFWHAMNGNSGAELERLAARFNASQREFRVVAVYKGTYEETLAAAIAARKTGLAPHIVQVAEAGIDQIRESAFGSRKGLHDRAAAG